MLPCLATPEMRRAIKHAIFANRLPTVAYRRRGTFTALTDAMMAEHDTPP